jgi:threonyl-tRNA synthetase
MISAKIEAKMHELASKDIPNERRLIPKPEAIELYRQQKQEFKCELVEEKPMSQWFPLHHRKIYRFCAARTFLPPAGSKHSN